MLFIISQKEKSATVKQPKYQSSSLQFFYISINLGCIFSSQQNYGDCWGNLPGLQLLRLSWQMSAMMLSLMSCLLLNMSSFILSLMEVPSSESWLALRIRYSMMPYWPVTTKLPSLRKGNPLMIQSLASFLSQLSHSSGVKKRSLQASPRYSHSNRQTCALALMPKYPMTIHSSFSSRFIHNNPKKLFEIISFLMQPLKLITQPQQNTQNKVNAINIGEISGQQLGLGSEKEEIVVVLGCLLLEVVRDLDEGVVGVVQQELEVLEELVLVGRHDVVEERVALALEVLEGLLLQRQTFEGRWALHLLINWRLGDHLLGLFEDVWHVLVEGLNHPQVFGVAQIFVLLLALWSEHLHIPSQDSYFFVQVAVEVEVVKLAQPELIVIVIE